MKISWSKYIVIAIIFFAISNPIFFGYLGTFSPKLMGSNGPSFQGSAVTTFVFVVVLFVINQLVPEKENFMFEVTPHQRCGKGYINYPIGFEYTSDHDRSQECGNLHNDNPETMGRDGYLSNAIVQPSFAPF